LSPGSPAMLLIVRDGREKKIQVTIGEQPADFSQAGAPQQKQESLDRFGLTVQELTEELAEKFEYEAGSGVIISDVSPGGAAEAAGLKPGQLVEEVNRERVRSLDELQKALEKSTDSEKILLRLRSGNFSTYIVLTAK
ncbi:MAG TPA: PDZ domain-containing protein, partial [Desulforhopalus sp.]|nr:PDZ domain-containing protein [Desulforhopalus sp.]